MFTLENITKLKNSILSVGLVTLLASSLQTAESSVDGAVKSIQLKMENILYIM